MFTFKASTEKAFILLCLISDWCFPACE